MAVKSVPLYLCAVPQKKLFLFLISFSYFLFLKKNIRISHVQSMTHHGDGQLHSIFGVALVTLGSWPIDRQPATASVFGVRSGPTLRTDH